jgi:hypothetical protein
MYFILSLVYFTLLSGFSFVADHTNTYLVPVLLGFPTVSLDASKWTEKQVSPVGPVLL